MEGMRDSMNRARPAIPIAFVLATSLLNTALFHAPLFAFASSNLDWRSFNGISTLVTLFPALFLGTATVLFVLLMLAPRLVKTVCMLIAVGNSIALYFIVTYRAVLD